jgi:hypothetical protein
LSFSIDEYASSEEKQDDLPLACVFVNRTGETGTSSTRRSGILEQGRYESMLAMHPFDQVTLANGTGLVDFRHSLAGNGTTSGRTLVSGNLTVRETVRS